jgi:uncharacterized protein YbjQ (UPF0145 family)
MVELAILAVLIILGFVFGRLAERRHYKSIQQRERAYRRLVIVPGRVLPNDFAHHGSRLVRGNVVVSIDYFKGLLASLRNLVGGNVSAFESLLDRARREAVLRMQEQAHALDADAVFNMKFETSRVSGNAGQMIGSVEVLAYGTALIPPDASARNES